MLPGEVDAVAPVVPERRWLIAGLGNPGSSYEKTWHNLGFLVLDRLAERNGLRFSRKECQALVGAGKLSGADVWLAKPQTFMNLSGVSLAALLEKYELQPANLLLVYDDLDLPWTNIRVRPKGSSGGHKGVQSAIREVGSSEFARVRLGIHPGHPIGDGAEFVLSPIRRGQAKELEELLDAASRAVESIVTEGVEKAMASFNRRAPGSKLEEE
jgi:peptidyl-tRNA hydrolase, PTH1 family